MGALCKSSSALDFAFFTEDGLYSDWHGVFTRCFPIASASALASKILYWQKKSMIGILAKMMGNRLRAPEGEKDLLPPARLEQVWVDILHLKFSPTAAPFLTLRLAATADAYLLEFDRHARKRGSFWGGMPGVGTIYGDNMMGKFLMRVRCEILARPADMLF